MKKSFFSVFLLFNFSLFAQSLQVVSTNYFNIIYDPKLSAESAALLYEHADSYADEILEKLPFRKFKHRMPIFIKHSTQMLNGYFAEFPYSHIVIFDTSNIDGLLGNQKDLLLKVFYHELTHAITLRCLRVLQPMAMKEGSAVLFESLDGNGRLNDPRILHQFAQDRLDGRCPSWSEVSGGRDSYPGAFWSYVYGGAFAKYLLDVYGLEKYKKYINIWAGMFTRLGFKKHYKIKQDDAWEDFIATIPFPNEVYPSTPLFNTSKKSIYSVTASCANKLAVADLKQNRVYFFNTETGATDYIRISPFVYGLSFSSDGVLLAISDFVGNQMAEKNRVLIYDTLKKRFLPETYKSIRYATFSKDSSKICGVEVSSQYSNIVLIDRKTKEKSVLFKSGPGFDYSNVYNIVTISQNEFAFIASNGLTRDILFIDANTKHIKKLNIKNKIETISELHTSFIDGSTILTFAWINKGDLGRMCMYNVSNGTFKILDKNISGGAFSPVYFSNKDDRKGFAVIGKHGTYHELCYINETELSTSRASLQDQITNLNIALSEKSLSANIDLLQPKKYNPFMKMWHPLSLPFYRSGKDFASSVYGIWLWSHDPTNRFSYNFITGYIPKSAFGVFQFIGTANTEFTNTSISFTEDLQPVENIFVHKTGFGISNIFTVHTGIKNNSFSLNTGINFDWFAPSKVGETNVYKAKYTNTLMTIGIGLNYSDFIRDERLATRYFYENIYGFGIETGSNIGYNFQKQATAFQLQSAIMLKTPVVPFECIISGFIGYNTKYDPINGAYVFFDSPTVINVASLLPRLNAYKVLPSGLKFDRFSGAFGVDTSIRIFSAEIQKSSLWLPITYNRINIDFGYKSVLSFYASPDRQKPLYLQSLYLNATTSINGRAELGFSYAHPIQKGVKFGTFDLVVNVGL